jgi:hypothetical protein
VEGLCDWGVKVEGGEDVDRITDGGEVRVVQ